MAHLLLTISLLFPGAEPVAKRAVPIPQRAVDSVSLADGERLLGMVIERTESGGASVVVGREWLLRNAPALYQRQTAGEENRRREILKVLADRIAGWRVQPGLEPRLSLFLEKEAERVQTEINARDHQPSQLLVVQVPREQLRSCYVQQPARRTLLGLAWEQRLDDVEQRSAAELLETLKAAGVDPAAVQPDLSSRIPVQPESDRPWAARMALVEYAYLGKPHFQGTGNVLLRADSEAKRPTVGELTGALITDRIAAGATRPAADEQAGSAITAALRSTEQEGLHGLRITRVEPNPAGGAVKVEGQFLARMPDNSWQVVWRHSQSADTAKARPQEEARIAQDPQVAPVLGLLKGLGLAGAQEMARMAIRQGAATIEALDGPNGVNTRFEQLVLRHTRRLDSPPLTVANGPGIASNDP